MPVELRPVDLYAACAEVARVSARGQGRVDLDATRAQLEQVGLVHAAAARRARRGVGQGQRAGACTASSTGCWRQRPASGKCGALTRS